MTLLQQVRNTLDNRLYSFAQLRRFLAEPIYKEQPAMTDKMIDLPELLDLIQRIDERLNTLLSADLPDPLPDPEQVVAVALDAHPKEAARITPLTRQNLIAFAAAKGEVVESRTRKQAITYALRQLEHIGDRIKGYYSITGTVNERAGEILPAATREAVRAGIIQISDDRRTQREVEQFKAAIGTIKSAVEAGYHDYQQANERRWQPERVR